MLKRFYTKTNGDRIFFQNLYVVTDLKQVDLFDISKWEKYFDDENVRKNCVEKVECFNPMLVTLNSTRLALLSFAKDENDKKMKITDLSSYSTYMYQVLKECGVKFKNVDSLRFLSKEQYIKAHKIQVVTEINNRTVVVKESSDTESDVDVYNDLNNVDKRKIQQKMTFQFPYRNNNCEILSVQNFELRVLSRAIENVHKNSRVGKQRKKMQDIIEEELNGSGDETICFAFCTWTQKEKNITEEITGNLDLRYVANHHLFLEKFMQYLSDKCKVNIEKIPNLIMGCQYREKIETINGKIFTVGYEEIFNDLFRNMINKDVKKRTFKGYEIKNDCIYEGTINLNDMSYLVYNHAFSRINTPSSSLYSSSSSEEKKNDEKPKPKFTFPKPVPVPLESKFISRYLGPAPQPKPKTAPQPKKGPSLHVGPRPPLPILKKGVKTFVGKMPPPKHKQNELKEFDESDWIGPPVVTEEQRKKEEVRAKMESELEQKLKHVDFEKDFKNGEEEDDE